MPRRSVVYGEFPRKMSGSYDYWGLIGCLSVLAILIALWAIIFLAAYEVITWLT